jgi:adenylate kinase
MRLILLGAPGAGKGTQGALLANRLGIQRIVTGDILRTAVREDTLLGREARRYMDAGELVPDALIIDMLREVLAGSGNGFIMDGFPRTLDQAVSLDGTLRDMDLDLDAVIVLDVPEDVLVKRISGRQACPRCGAVYNVYFEPPPQPGTCDRCGAELAQRADDQEDTVLHRLQVYHQQTRPVIDHYQTRGTPVEVVDGHRPVEDVQAAIHQLLPPP